MVKTSRREVGSDNGSANCSFAVELLQYIGLTELAQFKSFYPRFFSKVAAATVI